MSFDLMLEVFVLCRIVDAAMDEPAATDELVQRVIDDEIGSRNKKERSRTHRAPKNEAQTNVRRTWERVARRLIPKMMRLGLLTYCDGKLYAVPPRNEDAYAHMRIATVFGVDSDRLRVYDAAKVVLRTQPEFGVRGIINYPKMTRPKNKRALADADVFEAMMWFALSGKLFKMWCQKLDTGERVSAEDGLRMMSDDDDVAKTLVPMFGVADVSMHERRLHWLEERRWKVHVDQVEAGFMAQGSRTRFVSGEERTRHSRAIAKTAEAAIEDLMEKTVLPASRALDYY